MALPRHDEDRVVVTHSYAPDPDRKRVKAALDLWANSVAEQLLYGKTPKATTEPRTPARPAKVGDQP